MLAGTNAAARSDLQRPSMAQDMAKGRRTEIEFMNGFIAEKGAEVGVPAPTHAMLTEVVKRVERGEIAADPANVLVNLGDVVALGADEGEDLGFVAAAFHVRRPRTMARFATVRAVGHLGFLGGHTVWRSLEPLVQFVVAPLAGGRADILVRTCCLRRLVGLRAGKSRRKDQNEKDCRYGPHSRLRPTSFVCYGLNR